jgi:hypothetical protein
MKKIIIALLFFVAMSLLAYRLTAQGLMTPDSGMLTSDGMAINLGLRFVPKQNAMVTGARYYRGFRGDVSIGLWRNGYLLASATSMDETTGWKEVLFASPIPVAAGQEYIISYLSPFGNYFSSPAVFPMKLPKYTGIGGTYTYSPTVTFPASQFGNSQYFIEPVIGELPPPDSTRPVKDTVYIDRDTCSIDYSKIIEFSMSIHMTDTVGVARVSDTLDAHKALTGAERPHIRFKEDTSIRMYRFTRYYTVSGVKTAVRFTLYKTGAWIRERQINGVWTIWNF